MVLEPSMKRRAVSSSNEKKVQFIKLLTQIGPEITEIASRIGVHKETVRYWYYALLARGFAVQASYDFEKLGMQRIVMLVELDDAFKEHARDLFLAMNSFCYLVSYERIIPEGIYLLTASVPTEFVDDYVRFAESLREKELFKSTELFECGSFKHVPMRADFYNFETDVWDFDWSSPHPASSDVLTAPAPPKGRFDMLDLLVLQEHRIDANRSLVDIQEHLKKRNVDVNYKTLDWHYREHVLGLIKSYAVNWMGTRYSFQLEKAMHRMHAYLGVNVIVKNITESEGMHLMGAMNSLPFQWCEAVGRNYFSQFAFPTENISEAFLYFEKSLAPVKQRASHSIADQSDALSFTIEPSLYDEKTRRWIFDREALTSRFEKMILQIKGREG